MSTGSKRVCIVAIGGASSSGKTTLVKHLRHILPDAIVLHQDDCTPPSDTIPVHPVHGVQDWDDPKGCMDWPKWRATIKHVRATGQMPPGYTSRDHLNEQHSRPIPPDLQTRWRDHFASTGSTTAWVLVEGFLAFWDQETARDFDIKLLVRAPRAVLKARREARAGYVLSSEAHGVSTQDGDRDFWEVRASSLQSTRNQTKPLHRITPPGYFDNIVWPAYVEAHRDIFEDGDVEQGRSAANDLQVIESATAGEMVDASCKRIAATMHL